MWGGVSAIAMRYGLTRWVFQMENPWVAAFCSYSVMIGLFFVAVWFIDFSGFQLKGLNDEPMQKLGYFILFFSPIGLPLTIGGPIVFVGDMLRMLKDHFRKRAL